MKVFEIANTIKGVFINRSNRYLAKVLINDKIEDVHVHDPGRLKELLYKNNSVLIKRVYNPKRKTKYDLIAAKKSKEFVLVNSMYHRYIAENILRKKYKNLNPEVKYNNSRIDFLAENQIWIEIKGCTLSENNIAKFPDAPTKRGLKHLNELIELKEKGYESHIYFLIFSTAEYFSPNYETDPKFSKKLIEAYKKGVKIFPLLFSFKEGIIYFERYLDILMKG
ncbi:sugar fermentation stimulation protein A [Marinitoga hydrogenitolerans DSM 16785]|uniref:Sugar fermentation stimulation protein homolog n=1 Tax=Marinitoga hydrogenitolerans (strain DSM 16785 / JCM 12826 / AT1271) TaxID=1122195 RepID=A0A1M4XSX9_MARH1|nr:DNA/RNA nuclease SfsA [Marinitoga hydrogenitolerans]SHE96383.1 sugar fermentation stimulation protein A [Marinitoga hydrogenitolerans DSM 16785]